MKETPLHFTPRVEKPERPLIHTEGGSDSLPPEHWYGEILAGIGEADRETEVSRTDGSADIIAALAEGKEFSEFPAPARVVAILEQKCNLKCRHCYWDHEPATGEKVQDWSKQMDQIIKWRSDLFYAGRILTPKAADFIRSYCQRSGKKIGVVDNGYTILQPKFADLFELYRSINISLDGVPEDHDYQRNESGSFDVAMNALRTIKRDWLAGHEDDRILSVSSVITKFNAARWEEFEEILRKEGLPLTCTPVLGTAETVKRDMPMFTEEEFVKVFEKVLAGTPKLINLYAPRDIRVLMPILERLDWESDGISLTAFYKNQEYEHPTEIVYRPLSVEVLSEVPLMWDGKFYTGKDAEESDFSNPLTPEYALRIANDYAKEERPLIRRLLKKQTGA